MAEVKAIPDNYPRVCAYLVVDGAAAAIDFYTKILGATERLRLPAPGGKVGHAELQIGDSVVMLADEFPEMNAIGPKTIGGTPVSLVVYVESVDETFRQALEAGATELEAPSDRFYGERSGEFLDPFGHRWSVMTHIEDVSPEELQRRMAEMGSQ
jgi:PhnB protein